MSEREISCSLMTNFQICLIFTIWNPLFAFPLRMFLKIWTLSFEKNNHSGSCITVKVSRRTQNVEVFLADEEYGLAFYSNDLGYVFGSNAGNDFGVMLRRKGSHKPEFVSDNVRKLSHDTHGPD